MSVSVIQCITRFASIVENSSRWDSRGRSLSGGPHFPRTSLPAPASITMYGVPGPNREGLIRHLAEAWIGTGIHYPVPLHLQKAYTSLGNRAGDFPVTERTTSEIVSFPMFPQLTGDQQALVVSLIKQLVSPSDPFVAPPVVLR
jgi:hypothetical protein